MYLCILALLTFFSLETSGTNPGVKVRVTQKGLDYESQISRVPLQEMLKSISIPDKRGGGGGFFFEYSYEITDMQVVRVSLPLYAELVSGTGVNLYIGEGYISLRGSWQYSTFVFDDSGTFDMSINGLRISVNINVVNDGSGRPMVISSNCRASMNSVTVDIHGGFGPISWLYDLFESSIESSVFNSIQPQICPMVYKGIDRLNPHLRTLKVIEQVDKYAEIDYSMVGSPLFTYYGVDIGLKGEYYNIRQHEEPPFSPTPFSLPEVNSKMLYIGLSEFNLNSANFVYNKAGLYSLNVTDDMIPSYFPFRLDTKSFGLIIPQIAKQYPGLKMKLVVASEKEPDILLEPDNVTMLVSSNVKAFAIQPNNILTPLFILNVNASVSGQIYVRDARVTGAVTLNKMDVTLRTSYVGPILVKILAIGLTPIMNATVIPRVNERLKQGYPLPTINEMEPINAELQIMKDYILIGTDVHYVGLDKPDVL